MACRLKFATWRLFGRHMTQAHGIDRDSFWRRAQQVGDEPCVAVCSLQGYWYLMVQGRLM